MLRAGVFALLVGSAAAWPSFLSCFPDAGSRFVPGKIVMGGPVGVCGAPGAPDPCPVAIVVSSPAADGTATVNVTTAGR
eukprot:gene13589-12600_t